MLPREQPDDGRGLVIEAAGGWVLTFQINPGG